MNTPPRSIRYKSYPPPSGNLKRVLILMSNTGGGHRAAAEAIQKSLTYLYGEAITVTIVDAWKDHVARPINRLADAYGWIVNKAVWLWKCFWLLENVPKVVNNCLKATYPLVAPGLFKLFQAQKPDVIVSTHPLITFFPLTVLKQAKLNIPFITVVTDMVHGYHTWYDPQTTLFLVATEPARQQALDLGIPAKRIEVVGQPVDLRFVDGIGEKFLLRHKLGLDPNRSAVLLAGGGEGYGAIFEIARSVAQRVSPAQLIIVAGRNRVCKKNWKR